MPTSTPLKEAATTEAGKEMADNTKVAISLR